MSMPGTILQARCLTCPLEVARRLLEAAVGQGERGMGQKHHKPEQIIAKLQWGAAVSSGARSTGFDVSLVAGLAPLVVQGGRGGWSMNEEGALTSAARQAKCRAGP